MKTTVLAIGRWMPIHLGHKKFLINLARTYDRLVIGIGSCYENGTPRNCIPAIEREKLLRRIFKKEGIDNVIIVPVQDRVTFEEWFSDVISLCEKFSVTHFCTGNKEDILNVMREKNLSLNAEMINPEDTSDFPYHATDIRNAILEGRTDCLDEMIPSEIKDIVLSQIAKEIKYASMGMGQEFVPGRQTVDMVFIVKDEEKKKNYLLIGKRNKEKIDFPNTWAIPGGGINEFESPADACVRCFFAESGIRISIDDNSCEPCQVTVESIDNMKAGMYFTGIYASEDTRINGTRGGGSQCFAVAINGSTDKISEILNSTHDLEFLTFIDVNEIYKTDFAYDQKRMVYNALNQLGIAYDIGELLQAYDEKGIISGEGVLRSVAHRDGILHAASHTYIYKWENDELLLLLQRRSLNKDSYPGCLDTSSAGHVEFGSDFPETAQKELFEELGIEIDTDSLTELFVQTVNNSSVFHDNVFIDKEINHIYALNMDCDPSLLSFQPSEVSEAVWMKADDILRRLEANDSELCLDKNEAAKVIDILTKAKK